MLGVESNGWRAYALELWVESRERVADELCARADCFARLGFVEEPERDRYVAGRLRNRADIDRAEAAELWRSLQCCSGSPLVNHWRDSIAYDVGSKLSKSPT